MTNHKEHTIKPKPRILLRADGNSQIGLGHVIRTLALAEMLSHDFQCVFAIQDPDEALKAHINQVCDELIELPRQEINQNEAINLTNEVLQPTDIVVLDGYSFETSYQQAIKHHGCALVCIDDTHAYHFVADVVLNQAGGVKAEQYSTAPYTKLLLGPSYALLRKPFLKKGRQAPFDFPTRPNLFINLGGADPNNLIKGLAKEIAVKALFSEIHIVIGSAYIHFEGLSSWSTGKQGVTIHKNLSAKQMASLMQACPVAITSASGVAYEYASIGGLLFVLQTADNQRNLFRFLTSEGLAIKFDDFDSEMENGAQATYEQLRARQKDVFDGKTADRLLHVLHNLSLQVHLQLKDVTQEDLEILFIWANDPEVRKNSFNSNPILLDSHTRWFHTKLADKHAKLYIAECDGTPAAHIRFELAGEKATISYLIGPDWRGRGLAHSVLSRGIQRLLEQEPHIKVIEGLVQKENKASIRAFEKAGFSYGTPEPVYPKAHKFVLQAKR